MLLKRILCLVFALVFSVSSVNAVGESNIEVSAVSAILYCPDNNEILYQKSAHKKMAIASITKIMTAIIALESNDKEVKFDYSMIAEGSSMYLKVGDVIKISELVKGMMMVSGNDAANAIAIALGGSMEKFADMMNKKADSLGMKDTHFVTPSGLDDELHYSTAYDMALLCSYAMQNENFRNIVSQKSMSVEFISPDGQKMTYRNHNKLLSLYDGCIGIKTGFTKKAGRTLTSCAERDGVRLIAVTLNDGNDWNDHISMYDYGFSQIENISLCDSQKIFELPVVGSKKQIIKVIPKENCCVSVLKNQKENISEKIYMPHFVYAPVEKNKIIGEVRYYIDNKMICKTDLITSENCLYDNERNI